MLVGDHPVSNFGETLPPLRHREFRDCRSRGAIQRPLIVLLLATIFFGSIALPGIVRAVAIFDSTIADSLGPPDTAHAGIREAYGKLPLSFEANQGQSNAQVLFLSRGPGYTLFLTTDGAVLSLSKAKGPGHGELHRLEFADARPIGGASLRMQFVEANSAVRVRGLQQLEGRVNYLIGNDPGLWHTGIPTYARVVYHDILVGVDLVYYGSPGRLEYDFLVAPGADPSAIAMRFVGSDRTAVGAQGNLVLTVGGVEIRQEKPFIYQEVGGSRKEISGGYVVAANGEVRITLANYDSTLPLVIDPVLVYSTFLGGSAGEEGYGIAVDAGGNAFVSGVAGPSFPTVSGGFDTTYNGGGDAFVTKLNPAGTSLIYSTYLGGSGGEEGFAISLDAAGNAYIAGATSSTDFPTTAGAYRASLSGGLDAFVTKLNPTGTGLAYSTYLGGSDGMGAYEGAFGIAVDTASDAYVTGITDSTDFPTTTGAFDTSFNGFTEDAFVTKLNPTGTSLIYSTYLGGNGFDRGSDIAIDAAGDAFVTGDTGSETVSSFPTSTGAFDTSLGGGSDAFVTRLNPAGTGLIYSTFLGGDDGGESGSGIALDGVGDAYVTGTTISTNFPTTPGAFDTTYGSNQDIFLTKLNPAGTGLVYSTYLGGASSEQGLSIALDSADNAYVTGFTGSTDFPTTTDAFDTSFNGGHDDAFVTELNPTGTGLVYSTYLGGNSFDHGDSIAIDTTANAYVTGFTTSVDFPTTAGAFDRSYDSGDAFVVKFGEINIGPPASLTLAPKTASNTVGTTHCVTATVRDDSGNFVPDVTVRFSVPTSLATHASPSGGSASTDANGQATFCYSASLPGEDTIHAFADTDSDGTEDAGEPFDDAAKTWTPPANTAFCEVKITDGGWFVADDFDQANFGGNAKVSADGLTVTGQETYQDKGPAQQMNVHSTDLIATTCSNDMTMATIFGTATIDGSGTFIFRIDVIDLGESGTNDAYGIILSNGYFSGEHQLQGGNVQIHQTS